MDYIAALIPVPTKGTMVLSYMIYACKVILIPVPMKGTISSESKQDVEKRL